MQTWRDFWQGNLQWMLASLVLAFGLWLVAVLENDPVQERDFQNLVTFEFRLDDDVIITEMPNEDGALVTVRAPQSEWNDLRAEDIMVYADLQGLSPGTHTVELQAELDDDLRGAIVDVSPRRIVVTLETLTTRRLPIRTIVTQEPPSGYSYPPPTCTLSEVSAQGPQALLENAFAVARLNLEDYRNPVTLTVNLVPANEAGRSISGITLETTQVECTVQIAQIDGVSELSVVPTVEGFPPEGYIYEGYEFSPQTVIVTGRPSAIRNLNGIVNTAPIDLSDATSNFEQVVALDLPEGVRPLQDNQPITVQVQIGTVQGSRQYMGIPIQVEGLLADLSAELLTDSVTVFVVGPQPILETLQESNLRATINVEGDPPGTYQKPVMATVTLPDLSEMIQLTVQPAEVNVTITEINALELNTPDGLIPDDANTP